MHASSDTQNTAMMLAGLVNRLGQKLRHMLAHGRPWRVAPLAARTNGCRCSTTAAVSEFHAALRANFNLGK